MVLLKIFNKRLGGIWAIFTGVVNIFITVFFQHCLKHSKLKLKTMVVDF